MGKPGAIKREFVAKKRVQISVSNYGEEFECSMNILAKLEKASEILQDFSLVILKNIYRVICKIRTPKARNSDTDYQL